MELSDGFRVANLVTGVLMILGGIGQFFPTPFGVQNVIVAVYLFIFGIGTGLLEFQIPPQVSKFCSFMFSFLGRGIFYIFLGSITCGDTWWKWTAGIIIVIIGLAYVALEFVPSIEPPANMREADPSWGQEQI